MNWYYVEQGQQAGPITDEQLEGMLRTGKIQPETLVWHEGMPTWVPCREVKGGAVPPGAATGAAAEAVCAECGKMFPIGETIKYGSSYVCAACKPVFLQKLREGARLNTGGLNYAGFWIRFAAKLLDGLILGAVIVIPMVILVFIFAASSASSLHANFFPDLAPHATSDRAGLMGNIFSLFFQLVFMAAQAVYSMFFLGKYGATPGKMACGLIVVDSDGNKISYGKGFGRGCAEILSRLICSIGYIIAAFDNPQKRALHDHICNTRVVYK